jgi:hypothetical protein
MADGDGSTGFDFSCGGCAANHACKPTKVRCTVIGTTPFPVGTRGEVSVVRIAPRRYAGVVTRPLMKRGARGAPAQAKKGSGRLIPIHRDLQAALITWRSMTGSAGPVIVGTRRRNAANQRRDVVW